MTQRSFNRYTVLVLALSLWSFFMAGLVSERVFERLPHLEDELAYLYQARIFAHGDLTAPIPAYRTAYWQPFVVSYDQTDSRFGKYTPGWPALLAVGLALGQAWIINGFFALLTVALVYRLGKEIFDPDVGLIAAALTAFSPMALLLNGTLMAHPAALLMTTLFIYAYWRITRGKSALRWGIVAGMALGALVSIRPLTAATIALPFVAWSGLGLVRAYPARRIRTVIRPLLALSATALLLASSVPLFSLAATGDAGQNLYELVWEYDKIGFGDSYGRNGHNIAKGINHARYDLSLMNADLFGFTLNDGLPGLFFPDDDAALKKHLLTESDFLPAPYLGLSFFLVIVGAFVGLRRRWWMQVLLLLVIAWIAAPMFQDAAFLKPPTGEFAQAWRWLLIGIGPLFAAVIPLALMPTTDDQTLWAYLLGMVGVALIVAHTAYWVGSQRYSTRYYYEGLTALSLLGALPITWLMRAIPKAKTAIYALLAITLLWSLSAYSLPRTGVLHDFNRVSRSALNVIESQREGDTPVLILATGDNMVWRSFGTFMGLTDPYFESDIIVAYNYDGSEHLRGELIAAHPGRQVIDIVYDREDSWLADCLPERSDACRVNPSNE